MLEVVTHRVVGHDDPAVNLAQIPVRIEEPALAYNCSRALVLGRGPLLRPRTPPLCRSAEPAHLVRSSASR